jgi:benzodiazapine receptor
MVKLSQRLGFLVLIIGTGAFIGMLTAPGEWYAALQKPIFNPPNWIFGPVWTVLYGLIAWVGWRVWQRGDSWALQSLWGLQMILNFAWSPVFFGAQQPVLALLVIGGLLFTLVLFIRTAWSLDRLSAVLFIPYMAWVGFASALNLAIVVLN